MLFATTELNKCVHINDRNLNYADKKQQLTWIVIERSANDRNDAENEHFCERAADFATSLLQEGGVRGTVHV